ncbi:MAG: DNA-3-methyladenine glycosylase [Thermomicrobiales bacterium]
MTERIVDPALIEAGVAHLRAVDPIMAKAIDAVGPCTMTLEADIFYALVDAITSQQISIKAAASILKRICAIYAPDPFPTPERLAATPDEELRAAGCSRAKVLYLKDLAAHIVAGLIDLEKLPQLPDEEIIKTLVDVKGIGRWTAEMLLIFSLGRLDVWPVDDLGIVIAVQGLYELPARPKRKELLALGEPWRPYRTIASWYLWQSRRIVLGMPW